MTQAQLHVALAESGEEANAALADAGGDRASIQAADGTAADARKDLVKAKLALELVQAEARTAAQVRCLPSQSHSLELIERLRIIAMSQWGHECAAAGRDASERP